MDFPQSMEVANLQEGSKIHQPDLCYLGSPNCISSIFKPRCDVDGVNPRSAKLGHSTVAGDLCLTKKTIASHVTPHFQWKQISGQQPGQVTEWSGYVVPPSLDTMPNPFQPL
jgi:hypothetical protein